MSRQPADSVLWLEALNFAVEKHRDQRPEPTLATHPINRAIEAARDLMKVGGVVDSVTVTGAILQRALAGTSTTLLEIEERFGRDVRRLVEEVADPPGLSIADRRLRQLARARTASGPARLLRLADQAAGLNALPPASGIAQRRAHLAWVGDMAATLGGTNAPLEALMAERLRQAWTAMEHPAPQPAMAAGGTRLAPLDGGTSEDLAKTIRLLQAQLSGAEELADKAARLLVLLGVDPGPRPGRRVAADRTGTRPTGRPRRFTHRRWWEMAKPGIGKITFDVLATGGVMTSIDGAAPFKLSASAAALLRVLAGVAGCLDDGFPPFVKYDVIAEVLAKATGHPVKVHAVAMGMNRLREQLLVEGHESPMLVEPSRRGVRLRLRRTPSRGPDMMETS